MNLLDVLHRMSLILAFYDNIYFFHFFSFFSSFSPKIENLKSLKICLNAILAVPRLIYTHGKKIRVILNNFEALNASQQKTLIFSRTRLREISQDFNNLLG